MTDDQRRSRGVLEGGTPGLATVHNLFSGRAGGARPDAGRSASGSGSRRGAEKEGAANEGSKGEDTNKQGAENEGSGGRGSGGQGSSGRGSGRFGGRGRDSRRPDQGTAQSTVVSLDGSKLNPHDLRDMIAQKEAEWQRAGQPGPDDQSARGNQAADQAGRSARSGRSAPACEPLELDAEGTPQGAPSDELAQPAWTLPGWGADPAAEPTSTRGQQPRAREPRRTSKLDRRPRRDDETPGGPGQENFFGEPPENDSPRGRSGGGRRNGLSRKRQATGGSQLGRRNTGNGYASNEYTGNEGPGGQRLGNEGSDSAEASPARRRPPVAPELEAREILLKQLSAGDRTRAQLAKVLAEKEIPDDVAAAVLDRFEEVDLVDDAAFSRQYVENRHTGKGLAKRALAYELRQKGVADETAREALDSLSSEDELATARQLVRKKAGSMTKDDPERRLRRLAGMLARKGYSSGIAYQAIREELAELDAEGMFGHPDFD
ncbi:hypothetical protein Kisp01_33010 [Kineosporia sp. NBRC 101677]|uniref:RecX family transcriptional regulator n=1 Tax=Kineosporia sp. NBRC 101677 TaxID=3032197 RepID=UPI0024A51C1D|nr:RecX family transcriptional regulator [Kineosporia sp. NBRC 101677]GLY16286.1 hypothetical protein Kisp01_33010 [Kineosporia sp. NBRC 101677]